MMKGLKLRPLVRELNLKLVRRNLTADLKNNLASSPENKDSSSIVILGNVARNMLSQQGYILNTITDDDYVKHHQFYHGSSVGGHIRHSLDHWSKLVNHDFTLNSNEVIDYDSRERNTEIETNRLTALESNERVLHALNSVLQYRDFQTSVKVMFLGDSQTGVRYTVDSTFGRELSFVSHHATHHLSTIKLLMQSMSYTLPPTLGMAISTIQHWNSVPK